MLAPRPLTAGVRRPERFLFHDRYDEAAAHLMPRQILVLDDEPAIRLALRHLVERAYSAEVLEASTNTEALTLLHSTDVDLETETKGSDPLNSPRHIREGPGNQDILISILNG